MPVSPRSGPWNCGPDRPWAPSGCRVQGLDRMPDRSKVRTSSGGTGVTSAAAGVGRIGASGGAGPEPPVGVRRAMDPRCRGVRLFRRRPQRRARCRTARRLGGANLIAVAPNDHRLFVSAGDNRRRGQRQLIDSGEFDPVSRRHALWCLGLVEREATELYEAIGDPMPCWSDCSAWPGSTWQSATTPRCPASLTTPLPSQAWSTRPNEAIFPQRAHQ